MVTNMANLFTSASMYVMWQGTKHAKSLESYQRVTDEFLRRLTNDWLANELIG